jgi:pimeloyl-ACP methyl ester carboxylesterase
MERLAPRYRVIAADLYGSGKTAAWPHDAPMSMDDEVALLRPVFEAAGDRFHLIGHSYGGGIALKAALKYPSRLISLVLYEPVFFSLLRADAPQSEAVREITSVRDDTTRLIDAGKLEAAAERFIDYWMGKGAWAATPEQRRPALGMSMPSVKRQFHAIFNEPTPLEAFAALDVPILYLTGNKSTAAAHRVAELLRTVLLRVQAEEINGVGHMAPVTHPDIVNPLIERFLAAQ